LILTNVVLAV